jgi:hypothetical protein
MPLSPKLLKYPSNTEFYESQPKYTKRQIITYKHI